MKYKRLTGMLLSAALVLASPVPVAVRAEGRTAVTQIFVSPSGEDTNPGTEEKPLKTLPGAQKKVRELNDDMAGDIEVILRGGVYHQEKTFELSGEDSGTNGYDVIYKAYEGETPVISGGVPVTGWEKHDEEKNIYVADVSALGESFDTRQVYVDGKRAVRAKGEVASGDFTKSGQQYIINANGTYKDMASWGNLEDVELQSTVTWKNHRLPVSSVADGRISFEPAFWTSATTQNVCTPGAINRVENAYELLDEENEWYFDKKAKKIYYKPSAGAEIENLDIVAGKLEYIIKGEGTAQAPVEHIVFDGLQFSYNTWLYPNSEFGYTDFQGGAIYKNTTGSHEWVEVNYQTEAGVEFNYAKNCTISDCTFTMMGNAALSFLDGSENNTITRNTVKHVSGNGIVLGSIYKEAHQNDPQERIVKKNEISYNTVNNIGEEYLDNVGIFVGYTRETNVHHNTLYDLPYTAISMGWGWGETDMLGASVAGANTISHNLIHDYMKVLHDGGGIYTLGEQYETKIYNNYVYNNGDSNFVLYRDNGSAGILDTNNVVKASDGVTNYYFSTNYAPQPCHASHDNASLNNYYTAGMNSVGPGVNNNMEEGNMAMEGDGWPEGAVSVMANAGADGGQGQIPDLSQPNYGEYEADDTNMAVGAVATSSSDYSKEHAASRVNDNLKHTRWSAKSGANKDEWIMLNFGRVCVLDKIQLVLPFGKDFQYKYVIEYSKNSRDWNVWYDQDTYTDRQENTYELWGNPVKAQYVRVWFTDTRSKGCGLIEFKAFKTDQTERDTVSVLASAGEHGSISPGSVTEVAVGKTVTYNIIPDEGYAVHKVLVDGAEVGAVSAYTFDHIQDSHVISAVFAQIPAREYEKLPVESAESSTDYSGDYNAAKAIDGDWEKTRWSAVSGKVKDEWLEIDLGSVQDVDKIEFKNHPFKNEQFKFRIECKSGKSDAWNTVIEQKTYTDTARVKYELDQSAQGRYFRVYFTDTDGNGCSIYEIEASKQTGVSETPQPDCVVAFVSNGGTLVGSRFVKTGAAVAEPDVPIKEGYRFEGWFSDEACTDEWDFASPVNGNMTLYARWEKIPCVENVTSSLNPGVYFTEQSVELSCPTEGARIYYTVDGTDPTTDSKIYEAPIAVDATMTIKAMAVKEGMIGSKIEAFSYFFDLKLKEGLEEALKKAEEAQKAADEKAAEAESVKKAAKQAAQASGADSDAARQAKAAYEEAQRKADAKAAEAEKQLKAAKNLEAKIKFTNSKITLKSVKSAKKKTAKVTWKTVSGASGYQIQYATKSNFKGKKTVDVKKGKAASTTIKKLAGGKKYYVRIRAYKTIDGKKVYGKYSVKKSVKVK